MRYLFQLAVTALEPNVSCVGKMKELVSLERNPHALAGVPVLEEVLTEFVIYFLQQFLF